MGAYRLALCAFVVIGKPMTTNRSSIIVRLRRVLPALALLSAMSPSSATFLSADFRVAGDSALTVDLDARLEWLDLSYTDGVSYQAVAAGWGGLVGAEGFRFATRSEIDSLVTRAGLSITGDFLAANYAPAVALQSLLGITYAAADYQRTAGYYALGSVAQTSWGPRQTLSSFQIMSTSRQDAEAGPITLACIFVDCYLVGTPDYGAFLVRDMQTPNAVPTPGSLSNSVLGVIVALLAMRLRGRRAAR